MTDIELDIDKALSKRFDDEEFGQELAEEWKRLIDPYTPFRYGGLRGMTDNTGTTVSPFTIYYNPVPYIETDFGINYEPVDIGIEYLDGEPSYADEVYNDFYGKGYEIHQSGTSPYASAFWDKAAESAGEDEKLYSFANKYFNKE